MILEFIAAFSAGFALFGLTMLVNRLTGRRLARWAYPAAFAAGMMGFAIWSEYTWAARTTAPDTPWRVVETTEARSWFRPWTWVVPQTDRVLALDLRFTRVHPAQPDLIQTRVVRMARFIPESGFLAVMDCAAWQLAPLLAGVELQADGTLEGADWAPMPEGDPVMVGACALREEMTNDRGHGT